ncbi:hypothetical protein B0T10DRAFT_496121 [Thelonectria olida]|uniref:Uncharacterized protein n=1 Tax=Thelonectria olida TaxID=1576542 RepID=A0A9P8VVA7_9HYPO|nr:hypothetical protein B0T10DRAFT_496121 [Thelonectria olida]
MDNPDNTDETIPGKSPPVTSEPLTPTAEAKKSHTAAPPPSPSAAQQPREGINAVRARQRQQVKGQRSAPMMPAEDSPQTHRTGGMTIVYYDGYVQGFFGDLVKFISSSRYLMRRAKLAAKVAQLKKLAEVDHGDENALEKLCWLSSTRQYNPISSMTQPRSGHGGKDQHLSAYDKIDKRLEIVQSLCEHGAHQFLRDADCNEEIRKAHVQLKEAMEIATKEMNRVQQEVPELAKETSELGKVQTRQPISMRREMSAALKDGVAKEDTKLEAAQPADSKVPSLDAPLEVDPNIIEADEGIDVDMEIPKSQPRLTTQCSLWA